MKPDEPTTFATPTGAELPVLNVPAQDCGGTVNGTCCGGTSDVGEVIAAASAAAAVSSPPADPESTCSEGRAQSKCCQQN